MQDRANGSKTTGKGRPQHGAESVFSLVFAGIAVVALAFAIVEIGLRRSAGARFDGRLDGMVILAAVSAAALLGLRLLVRHAATRELPAAFPAREPLKELLDSAGPMIMAVGLDGKFTYVNPATERLLGYHAAELVKMPHAGQILALGEGARLIPEILKLGGKPHPRELASDAQLAAFMGSFRSLPPSRMPSFDAQLRRKDGVSIPVTLHVSALRDDAGEMTGLVAVALDQSAILHQEMVLRESQERYRDLFEHSTEMIATLSPAGQFLYANPAWKRSFGLDTAALASLRSFEEIFGPSCRAEAGALFRRVLDGEVVDRAPLRNHTGDGRVLELELSLSQRQKAGNPLAVRCLLRDITRQKQRENRLALQLLVSQIVGENSSPELAAMHVLEALCASHGWDVAIKWEVNAEENRLEFSSAWGAPGRRAETLIQESMGLTLSGSSSLPSLSNLSSLPSSSGLPNSSSSTELPVRAWQESRPLWITDLTSLPMTPRIRSALNHEMVSGWAVPVRVGKKVLGVLEFYCHFKLREDREDMAAIETVASSLGQMLARSRESGRAEELNRQQEILLNSVADGICGIDRHGLVRFANPAAARLLGATAASLIGRTVHELLHGWASLSTPCAEDCPLARAASQSAAGEDTVFRSDGSSFPAEYFLTPVLDQGRTSGSVLSFRDISQRYALDRLKDEFISTVSHELRTPLTSIRGALGLLSSGILGEVNEKAANLLRIALTNSDRLVRLINDILDLERIQNGREPLAFRQVQLAEIVRQAIDGMQPVADAAGVQLIHDPTQVEIAADPDRLLQVLTNLLSNAVKFSPPNSTISVMLHPGVEGATLSVIDQGRGIPADKLEAIFGRFQQVDASDSRQKGGSGLGLAICRTIVLQHAGRIWAERNPVCGSTFRMFLPYEQMVVGATAPLYNEAGQGTVLLADANTPVRLQIAAKLARHGYHVVEATNVEETIAAAHKGVQAILLDTSLDGMNGWKVLPLLRQMDPEANTPVVLLSLTSAESPADLPALAEGWVTRPLEEDELLGELARVLSVPGEKARILVVEDDVDLAGMIGEVFARDTIEVALAHTRQEALDACFAFQPNLLVLDIGLPDGDGFNVVDWLRQHETLAHLPLVVYSGRDLTPAERQQLTLGPTHFLAKTRVQPQQLEALVLTMLRSSRPAAATPVPAN
jgi:PAS domain S-box-containing protein